ncbi:hypothetical protein BFU36_12025 [Sulfolobus sp. A20]|uniref:ribbon-helix-helix domain-containing protein n=1 Tax=Sulfolobaceae TaxID=118883 RepID=UPI000845C2BC|nr:MULTISPECIES: ribbon-helix-helix domain-containing protein [unclassified Sulfolobus]TRM73019.1 ribbon-helix-helix protein, CopG family [Sulfolobus sp. E5]TRM73152.1 ribbon-helix-helix protein, CopG family [Sulfolobus sp. B5]TRM74446.1 ribbon-helix-helix protein, CopG family [Sulfolobus sp. A20-N-F8]TRM97151.1 ribbon-helix-helix protein, CopG family [Sulfolobus sp. E1]TRM99019.1 ribbon-helix-helix protein, CopG family [Sulfolobus sp. F1]
MGTTTVTIRIDKEVLKKIDELIAMGIFSSRNEALNTVIKVGLDEFKSWEDIIKKYEELKKRGVEVLIDKPLEEFLKERDRF